MRIGAPVGVYTVAFSLSKDTLQLRRVSCRMDMRHCWNGPISPLVAGGGRVGRSRFLEWVVIVVEPSGSPRTYNRCIRRSDASVSVLT